MAQTQGTDVQAHVEPGITIGLGDPVALRAEQVGVVVEHRGRNPLIPTCRINEVLRHFLLQEELRYGPLDLLFCNVDAGGHSLDVTAQVTTELPFALQWMGTPAFNAASALLKSIPNCCNSERSKQG